MLTPLAWVSMTGTNPSLPGDVAIYDINRKKLLAIIPVGIDPRFLECTPDGSKVYVPNNGSDTVSVISSNSFSVVAAIPVGKSPRAVTIDSIGKNAYVTNFESSSISIIDISIDEITSSISVSPNPLGLALSQSSEWLYITHQSHNFLSIVDIEKKQVHATLPVGSRPTDLALTPNDRHLYVINTGDNTISVVDIEQLKVITTIPVGQTPQKVVMHPSLPLAYVTNFNSNSVSVLSTIDHRVMATISPVITPTDIAILPDGSKIWVTDDYQITVINTDTNNIETTIYPPPTAQIRQGVTLGEYNLEISNKEKDLFPNQNSLRETPHFVTEKISMVYSKPLTSTINHEFGFEVSTIDKIKFFDEELYLQSFSTTPIALKPNYYKLTYTLRIPYKIELHSTDQQIHLIEGNVHLEQKSVEIHIPPTRSHTNLNLEILTHSKLTQEPILRKNSLYFNVQIQIRGIRRYYEKGHKSNW